MVTTGVALAGRVVVVDVTGIKFGTAVGLVGAFRKQNAQYPKGEHPLPDGALAIFMVGLPWSIQQLWGLVKKMLPASEQAKFRMHGSASDERFREDLAAYVEPSQIPPRYGGTSSEPWYLSGGDVPKGAVQQSA